MAQDLSKLSNEELMAIAGSTNTAPEQPKKAGTDLSSLSNEDLQAIASGKQPQEKSLLQKGGEAALQGIKGFNAGVAESTPFVNVFDKGAAAAAAGTQALFDLFRKPENQKAFQDRYDENLNALKSGRAADVAASPKAAALGNVEGAATGLAIPIPGAGVEGLAGAAARTAGVAGLGALETGTAGKEAFNPEAAAKGAILGGATAGIGEAGLGLAKAAAPYLAPAGQAISQALETAGGAVNDFAATKAVKAALGNSAKAWRAIGERVEPVGEQLLSEGVVSFGNNAAAIENKATAALEKTWDKIDAIHQAASDAGVTINGEDIAAKILDKASKIKDVPQNQDLINELQNQALYYEHKPQISLSEAQEFKNEYIWREPTGNTAKDTLGRDGNNAVKQAIGDSMKETVDASELPGKENYKDLLNKYGAYASAAGPAAETAIREAKNRGISLTDYLAGNIGANLLGNEHTPIERGLVSTVIALANKLGRERGNSALASTANSVGNLLENNADFANKFGNLIEQGIQSGGPGFAATNLQLMKNPDYQNAVQANKTAMQRRYQTLGGK